MRMQDLSSRLVKGALSHDHQRVDLLLAELLGAAGAGELDRAAATLAEVVEQVTRHMEFEERILFPIFESAMRQEAGQGPTSLLREEHGRIRSALAAMGRAIADASGVALAAAARELEEILPGHNQREERVLYRVVDRVLGPLGALVLAARLGRGPLAEPA